MSLQDYPETMCSSILGIDKNIQSVAIISRRGRVIEKNTRAMFSERFPNHLSDLFCMHQVLQVSMGRDFDDNYGPVNYHMSERANLTTLTFPLNENVLLVTTNKETSTITLARKIISMLDEYTRMS